MTAHWEQRRDAQRNTSVADLSIRALIGDCVASNEPLGWKLEPAGWKLLRVDRVRSFLPLAERFTEPRPGYRRGDNDIWLMYCQL